MKCPHCGKENETITESKGFRRLMLSSFVLFIICDWLIPWTVDNGYLMNWDMVIALILVVIFNIGMWLYNRRK